MKEKSGIALITLVITIILMLILAGAGISVGTESISSAKKTKFNAELRVVHSRVNELLEEMNIDEIGQMLTNYEYSYMIPNDKASKAITAVGSPNLEGYWYFNKTGLEKIGISSINREVLINFTTREVVDLEGIDSNGGKIYRLLDWKNVAYIDKTAGSVPTFSLSKKVYGLNAVIIVRNLSYGENVSRGTISYCLLNQDETDGEWEQASGTEIPVSVSGTYKVRVTNSAKTPASTTHSINIALTNSPKLDSGMVPVVYVEADPEGYWEIADENGGLWYDYAEDKAMWANVMLLDGLEVEGGIPVTAANKGDMVGKKVTTLGSMFVWIPRYMYKIPAAYTDENSVERGFHTSGAAEIGIKFLKGTTNIATDGTNETIADPYAISIPEPSSAPSADNPWIVHPAFTDGSKTNYLHGGWDHEITGIWVAKFEASSSTPSASNGGGNTTELYVKVLPNVYSWRSITVNNIFNVCSNMSKSNNIYRFTSNSDTHMMKNTEWGAVEYLTQSKHGQMSEGGSGQIWNNPNNNYKTGQAGSTADDKNLSTTSEYNTGNGQKASTTGNIYGIYDMAGVAWEYVAAYVATSTATTNNANMGTLVSANDKYVDRYSVGTSGDSQANNYNALYDSTNSRILKWGDAVYETSNGYNGSSSWQEDYSYFPHTLYPAFVRGGSCGSGASAGVFCFSYYANDGDSNYGFRPVCVVNF